MKFRAMRCKCGKVDCEDYFVPNCEALKGIAYSKSQSQAIVDMLNEKEWENN